MKISEFADAFERSVPRSWAEEWDNVGLLIGDRDDEFARAAVALDATPAAIESAARAGCALLVTHHPAVFRPLADLSRRTLAVKTARAAIRSGVAVYSAHTNWDSAPGGVNETLASQLGLRGISPLVPGRDGAFGMGAIGDLAEQSALSAVASNAIAAWRLSRTTVYGQEDRAVSRVALCGGAGGDMLHLAADLGADVFITADLRYHETLEAEALGIALIETDHGEMESSSLDALAARARAAGAPDVAVLRAERSVMVITGR